MKKIVVIGCDYIAIGLKNAARGVFEAAGWEVEDAGVMSENERGVFYPSVAERVCRAIIDSGYEKEGALFCGTGLGMAITANKFPGIRAGVCHDNYSAERLRLSNDGNIICMGQRIIGIELAKKILYEWCMTQFEGGPSQDKVDEIIAIERRLYK